jgi:hypothetical protein
LYLQNLNYSPCMKSLHIPHVQKTGIMRGPLLVPGDEFRSLVISEQFQRDVKRCIGKKYRVISKLKSTEWVGGKYQICDLTDFDVPSFASNIPHEDEIGIEDRDENHSTHPQDQDTISYNFIRFSFPMSLLELAILISSDVIFDDDNVDVSSKIDLWKRTFSQFGGWDEPNFLVNDLELPQKFKLFTTMDGDSIQTDLLELVKLSILKYKNSTSMELLLSQV